MALTSAAGLGAALKGSVYRRRRLEPASQRLRRLFERMRGGFDKRQRVYAVDIGEAALKHLVLPDACVAEDIATNLERLEELGLFPRLIARYRNELWMELIDGVSLDTAAEPPLEALADVYAALYKLESRTVPGEERRYREDVLRDVRVLADFGVVTREAAERLQEVAHRSAPVRAWFGYDYNDPRPQNFLRTAGSRLRAIDVESIRRDSLIGIGVARACLRWNGVERERFLELLRARAAPDFSSYLDFLDLAFAAAWTKRCVLQRKTRLIDRELLTSIAARV